MNNTPDRRTILCLTSRWVVVTVAVVVTSSGAIRGYALEASAWGGTVAAGLVVREQHTAVAAARRAVRAHGRAEAIIALGEGGAR